MTRLIAAGHRRIAYLTLPPDVPATALRVGGYGGGACRCRRGVLTKLWWRVGYADHRNRGEDLYAAIERLLMLAEPPTVLCCGNDEMALRVYGHVARPGPAVAESIFPWPATTITVPSPRNALSAAHQRQLPYVQMGTQAAALLLELIERGQAAGSNPRKVRGAWCGAIRLRSRRDRMGLYFIFNEIPFPTRHSKQKTIRSFT